MIDPTVRILHEFNPNQREFVDRTRYMEVWGGLGDVFNHFFWLPCYTGLDFLKPSDKAFVVCASHNSCTYELFAWHPNAPRITVCDIGFIHEMKGKEKRGKMGLPLDCDHDWPIKKKAEFYPPQEDLTLIENVKRYGKYVVFALTASDHGRSISKEIGDAAASRAAANGFNVVVTGRNYKRDVETLPKECIREERRLNPIPGVMDLIDKLTVPGTAKLCEGAAGVFTSHSALCMLAWHLKKPTYVLYDAFAKETYFTKKFEGYSFGAGYPGNAHGAFNEWNSDLMDRWLDGIKSR